MAAIISRTEITNQELSPTDGFDMAESFGIKSKNKTKDEDYDFSLQIPYIAKMQDKDKLLMNELMKSYHKYELTKIECTSVLTLNGRIFIHTAMRNSVIGWYIQYLFHPGSTRTDSTNRNTMTCPGLTQNVEYHCKNLQNKKTVWYNTCKSG
jgi:hypothetical protein